MVWSDASSPDQIKRDMQEEKRRSQQARTARTAEATSIGAGGIRVYGGNGITVEDGGRIAAEYPSGRAAVFFGPLHTETSGVPNGHGLLVQADDDGQGRDIFRAKYVNGQRIVYIGQTPGPESAGSADVFVSDAFRQSHHSHGAEGYYIHAWRGGDVKIQSSDGGIINIQSSDGADLQVLSDGRLWLYADDDWRVDVTGPGLVQTGSSMQILADGFAALAGDAGTYLQPESTGLAANMHMAADGRVFRSTSSRRYKTDIRDADVPPDAVLQLRPRTWLPGSIPRSCPEWLHEQHGEDRTCPAEQAPEPPDPTAARQIGFVAEELVEAGLGDFVEFNADGEPEAIYYDRLTAALVPLLQRQQQQIDALTAKVEQLTTRVSAQERAPDPNPTRRQ